MGTGRFSYVYYTEYIEAFAKAPAPKLVKLSPILSPTMEDFPKLTNPAA
jgi:hypothetical protein